MSTAVPRTIDAIDWSTWRAVDPATLIFVLRAGEILLIRKKRGLGAGKINGPGGRLEPGESPLACAIREMQEELIVTPSGLHEAGEISFQFMDGYSTHVHVFTAIGIDGDPRSTEEADPLWYPVDGVPYDEMWADDRLWLPHLIAGRPFTGRFIFDGEQMLDQWVEIG